MATSSQIAPILNALPLVQINVLIYILLIPIRACERGTNENHNGIIRRFLPKGTDFRLVDRTSVADIQQWINTYPRKLFNGDSPLMELQKYFGDSFSLPS